MEAIQSYEESTRVLSPEALVALQEISDRNGNEPGEVLSTAIINENFLQKHVEAGAEIILKRGEIMHRLEYTPSGEQQSPQKL